MGIWKWFEKKSSAAARALTMFLPLGPSYTSRAHYESLGREGYAQNSVVYACVREIAEAAAGVPWILQRRRADGELEEVADHKLLRLLARPNPLQGRFEFIDAAMAYLYISGNCYIELAGPGRPGEPLAQAPVELYLLRPDRVTIHADPLHLIGGYEYRVGSESVRFAPDRILHLKLFNPLNDWYGQSPLLAAGPAIDKLNAGDRWNAALLRNAAVPSGALVSRQRLTEEQFKLLEQEMLEKFRGPENAHKPLLLEGDLDWKEIGVTPKDMDWSEGMKFSALQIAQVYNMPPEVIGLSSATYQNRREARKGLYSEVVLPVLRRLRDALNNILTPRFGEDLALELDTDRVEALSEDLDSLWMRANRSSFLTLNEKRRLAGYDPVPNGDTVESPAKRNS